jgi:hypothetical protein
MKTIDLSGPDGNVFMLVGLARSTLRKLDRDPQPVVEDMMSATYEHALEVFEREFKGIYRLKNKP